MDDDAEQRALELACESDADITAIAEAFLADETYDPGVIFRGASDRVRGELVRRVQDPALDELPRHHLLGALAWIEHPEITGLFAAWRRAPPAWSSRLVVPVHEYPLAGGWELTPAGARRDLHHRTCHELVPRTDGAPSPVAVTAPLADTCAWCGHPLKALIEVDATAPACAFLGFPRPRARIPTCLRCGAFGTVLGHLTASPAWHPANVKPEFAPDPDEEWPELAGDLALSPQPSNPRRAASPFLEVRASQLGGHPTWIQWWDYPVCPGCAQRMTFIGQVDAADLDEQGEGIYHAFACTGCGVSATGYQQS